MESLTALRDSERECERHMFVFPASLMAHVADPSGGGVRVVRRGEVTMVCRKADQALPS